jgi:hypothetical protein
VGVSFSNETDQAHTDWYRHVQAVDSIETRSAQAKPGPGLYLLRQLLGLPARIDFMKALCRTQSPNGR